MAQTKQPETETPQSDTAQATGNVQDADAAGGNNTAPAKPPAPTPGETADVQARAGEKPRQKAAAGRAEDETIDRSRKRNGSAATNGNGHHDDYEPVRRDRQIAQGRHQDDDPGYGRQVRGTDDDYRRRDTEQRSLFGDPDDTYYDRRPHRQDRDAGYDRGRQASQGHGHTSARGEDERLSREYGNDYRRYSDAGYDDRNPYRSGQRAFDQSPYGDRDRYYSEGGQYRPRPQSYRPNDNGRDFEREAREQPRNRWREATADPRYDDAYDQHRNQESGNRAWSSQGSQDRHRDWDRDNQGRYSNERHRDEDRYRGQDRGYDQPSDRFDSRGYGDRSDRPVAREDDRGNPDRRQDDHRNYRQSHPDDRYEYDRGGWQGPGRRR